jgi:two-component system response regulator HydG
MSSSAGALLGTVVFVCPDADDGAGHAGALGCAAEEVMLASGVQAALDAGWPDAVDLVVVHDAVGRRGVLDALAEARAALPATPVVILSDEPSVPAATEFVRAGAADYVCGPLEGDHLEALLKHVVPAGRGEQAEYFCDFCPPGVRIVGRSDGLTSALETLQLVAASGCNPVLVLGETGSGKELLARGLHAFRCRQEDPFVAVNCAALTASLLESELFGHVKGAFTGAERDKAGLFETAGSGTIFLDEISEMPAELQAKLLRTLQERTFRRIGGTREQLCKANIVASSNRDLLAEVNDGRFRKDLYYRLAVFPIRMPSLRSPQRRGDILLLARYFVATSPLASRRGISGLSKRAEAALLSHDWPGNVRELHNVVERALILEKGERIDVESILLEAGAEPPAPAAAADPQDFSLETAEREFILRALKETGWQRTRAAALLGITRATLHSKLKRYGIKPPESAATGSKS